MQAEDWYCSNCEKSEKRGHPFANVSTYTPAGKLLDGSPELGLCKIESIWKSPEEPDEESYFLGRWYVIPEETRQGRKVMLPCLHCLLLTFARISSHKTQVYTDWSSACSWTLAIGSWSLAQSLEPFIPAQCIKLYAYKWYAHAASTTLWHISKAGVTLSKLPTRCQVQKAAQFGHFFASLGQPWSTQSASIGGCEWLFWEPGPMGPLCI